MENQNEALDTKEKVLEFIRKNKNDFFIKIINGKDNGTEFAVFIESLNPNEFSVTARGERGTKFGLKRTFSNEDAAYEYALELMMRLKELQR